MGVLTFLQANDLLSLALLSKKYYTLLVPTLEGLRLDAQQTAKQTRPKTQKSKPNKTKQ